MKQDKVLTLGNFFYGLLVWIAMIPILICMIPSVYAAKLLYFICKTGSEERFFHNREIGESKNGN